LQTWLGSVTHDRGAEGLGSLYRILPGGTENDDTAAPPSESIPLRLNTTSAIKVTSTNGTYGEIRAYVTDLLQL
jgi:hypothetical protein